MKKLILAATVTGGIIAAYAVHVRNVLPIRKGSGYMGPGPCQPRSK